MFICCHNSYYATPICPSGTAPQSSPAGFVPCDVLQPNQCRQELIRSIFKIIRFYILDIFVFNH